MVLSELVIAYLFLGGAGAGACFVAAFLASMSPDDMVRSAVASSCYGRLYASSFSYSCACLFVGLLCLSFDLGRYDALVAILMSPKASYIALGFFALFACGVLSFALALSWIRIGWRGVSSRRLAVVRFGQIVALAVSCVVMAYTGLLLQSVGAVPLWNSPCVPFLFVASSLSCGLALVSLSAYGSRMWDSFSAALRRMAAVDMAVVVLEAVSLVVLVLPALNATPINQTEIALRKSAERLVFGDYSILFWLGLVAAGLVVPLIFETLSMKRQCAPQRILVACCCVLVGGAFLRICLVGAGIHPEISTL